MTILSNGMQHIRSWIENDAIRLLVADYNNAGGENYLTSHIEKEYRLLKKGDKIQGKVTVTF